MLDYEFAPIDVSIATHPKAFAAGVEAMGLWLWGMAHAKQHRTCGVLTRAAVLGAWGGRRNAVLAARLVVAGLWLARDDGGWDIHNFEQKGPGAKRTSTHRVKRHREAKRNAGATPNETQSETLETRFSETSASVSVSTSSGSGSDLSDARAPDTPPPWFVEATETVRMGTGLDAGNVPARWLAYRASKERRGHALDKRSAQGWLATVLESERSQRPPRSGPRLQPAPAKAAWLDPDRNDFAAEVP